MISSSEFVIVAQPITVRRIVIAKRRPPLFSLKHIGQQARTFSWIVFIICCATRNVMAAPVQRHKSNNSPTMFEDETPTEANVDNEPVHLEGGGTGDRFRDVRPKWVNPCGGILDDSGIDPDAPPLEDSEIAANAILDVDIALNQIESFKDDFVRSLFRMDFDEMVRTWAHFHYDWLPAYEAVPKVIGAQLVPRQLQALELGATLKKLYLAAQTIAVGLEQVILDRAVYGGDFLEQFATTENKLAMVLCSLQMAMIEKHVEPDADAVRQLMDNKYRDMRSASGRNLRDFVIVRDYINLLEYTHQVLQHFQNGPSGSSS
ncbi:hypothetical protein GHT06_011027 [Daphnia sinensis]|uniref:Uncharacterized protein n=1 Tax=Daphnia sinensis TaxID=1820382 RepID=A0AAD5PZP1_9CRUS|nr:hypothetical protein GHT06_011027 [Daphnia sinensis]